MTTALTDEYYAALDRGELVIQQCGGCRTAIMYPKYVCPACGGTDLGWTPSTGRGVLHSFTIQRIGAPTGFEADLPYTLGVVKLDEGVQLLARLRPRCRRRLGQLPLRHAGPVRHDPGPWPPHRLVPSGIGVCRAHSRDEHRDLPGQVRDGVPRSPGDRVRRPDRHLTASSTAAPSASAGSCSAAVCAAVTGSPSPCTTAPRSSKPSSGAWPRGWSCVPMNARLHVEGDGLHRALLRSEGAHPRRRVHRRDRQAPPASSTARNGDSRSAAMRTSNTRAPPRLRHTTERPRRGHRRGRELAVLHLRHHRTTQGRHLDPSDRPGGGDELPRRRLQHRPRRRRAAPDRCRTAVGSWRCRRSRAARPASSSTRSSFSRSGCSTPSPSTRSPTSRSSPQPQIVAMLDNTMRTGSISALAGDRYGGARSTSNTSRPAVDTFSADLRAGLGQGEAPITVTGLNREMVPFRPTDDPRLGFAHCRTDVEVRVVDADGTQLARESRRDHPRRRCHARVLDEPGRTAMALRDGSAPHRRRGILFDRQRYLTCWTAPRTWSFRRKQRLPPRGGGGGVPSGGGEHCPWCSASRRVLGRSGERRGGARTGHQSTPGTDPLRGENLARVQKPQGRGIRGGTARSAPTGRSCAARCATGTGPGADREVGGGVPTRDRDAVTTDHDPLHDQEFLPWTGIHHVSAMAPFVTRTPPHPWRAGRRGRRAGVDRRASTPETSGGCFGDGPRPAHRPGDDRDRLARCRRALSGDSPDRVPGERLCLRQQRRAGGLRPRSPAGDYDRRRGHRCWRSCPTNEKHHTSPQSARFQPGGWPSSTPRRPRRS